MIKSNYLTSKKKFVYLFYLFCICTITISFVYKINLSNPLGDIQANNFLLKSNIYAKNGGAVSDVMTNWEYIQILRNDVTNLFSLKMGVDTKLLNFPLHNLIFSQIYILADNLNYYLIFFFLFSLTIPLLAYLNICERFKNLDKVKVLLISSLIYIFPVFQYSSIWGNSHITGLFFFLIGTLFHLKLKNSKYTKIKYAYIAIIFLAFTTYTKQYYIFFFIYLFVDLFLNIKLKHFILLSLFTFLLSIPGFLFLYSNPLLYVGYQQETTNFGSSILIASSICLFYLVPFLIQYFVNSYDRKKNIKKFINFKLIFISLVIFFICYSFFYYELSIGGGFFYKLSTLIFNNQIYFFISSFMGLYFVFIFTKNNIQSHILSLLIICTFSTGFFVFQKYFEPMIFLIILLYFDKKLISICLKKNNYIQIVYYLSYYFSLNYIYFFGI